MTGTPRIKRLWLPPHSQEAQGRKTRAFFISGAKSGWLAMRIPIFVIEICISNLYVVVLKRAISKIRRFGLEFRAHAQPQTA